MHLRNTIKKLADELLKIIKPVTSARALLYGWVSKYRNKIPYTILKIIFSIRKNFIAFFINI